MLQELHLHPRTRWLTLKGRLRDDRRYRAVPRGDREGAFNSFLAELEVNLGQWRLFAQSVRARLDSRGCAEVTLVV